MASGWRTSSTVLSILCRCSIAVNAASASARSNALLGSGTRLSTKPTPAACTLIRTAYSSGRAGTGISSTANPGGPFRPWVRSARIAAGTSGERGQAGDVPTDDQCLDAVGALVGVHDLHVGHVPGDVVLQQQTVPAEDVPGLQADLAGLLRGVHLGERGHRPGEPALLLELRHPEAHQLDRGDPGEHVGQLVLDELVPGDGFAELFALAGVGEGG